MQGEYSDPGASMIVQLVPLMIFQIIYAIIAFKFCRKQNWNAWLWTIASLIPLIGMFVFVGIFLTTILKYSRSTERP